MLQGASDGCDHGWITHADAITESGSTSFDASGLKRDGISVIARLDHTWSESVPRDGGERARYADRFVSYVDHSPDVHVWIVANEPNVTLGGEPSSYVEPYAQAYIAIRDRVHALPGHGDDVVLVSAPSPWSPCFLDGLSQTIERVQGAGVTVDGVAMHPGTGHTASTQDPARVTMDDRRIVCPGGRYESSYGEFRVYRDFIRVVEDHGLTGLPMYGTESAHNCEGATNCYENRNNGYFAAAYRELDEWNRSNATKVRALTPYRWLGFGDGTGRSFAISERPELVADLAGNGGYTWTTTSCGTTPDPDGCEGDQDCGATEVCNLANGACTTASACGASGSCEAGQLCRRDGMVCVPEMRGAAAIGFDPGDPDVGDAVVVDATDDDGYTHVHLDWEGPLGTGGNPEITRHWQDTLGGRHHWYYATSVAATGTYRATFSADPNGTIYAIGYLNVGETVVTTPPTDGGTTPIGPGFGPMGPGALDGACGCRIMAPRAGRSSGRLGGGSLASWLVVAGLLWRRRPNRHR